MLDSSDIETTRERKHTPLIHEFPYSENGRVKKHTEILWIDLRNSHESNQHDSSLNHHYKTHTIVCEPGTNGDGISAAIQQFKPQIICFDFDHPDQICLNIVKKTKQQYPSLPFLMFTSDHSTELAIWALRLRAWDYFVKPAKSKEVTGSIDALLNNNSVNRKSRKRNNLMPQPVTPAGSRPYKSKSSGLSTDSAISYVQQHLDKKITLDQVANHCGMSRSHFSRSFKSNHTVTFQEYLCQQRMNKAIEMLKSSECMITQVALAVGFTELSYFTRTFQRYIGIGPSEYRKAVIS